MSAQEEHPQDPLLDEPLRWDTLKIRLTESSWIEEPPPLSLRAGSSHLRLGWTPHPTQPGAWSAKRFLGMAVTTPLALVVFGELGMGAAQLEIEAEGESEEITEILPMKLSELLAGEAAPFELHFPDGTFDV